MLASTIYRAALRAAREFDSRALGSLLHLRAPTVDGRGLAQLPLFEPLSDAEAEAATAATAVLRGSHVVPSPSSPASGVAEALRSARRSAGKSSGILQCYAATVALQTALGAASELQRVQCTPPALRDALPSGRSLHEAAALRPGALLIDHPAVVGPGRAVALCYDISQTPPAAEGGESGPWLVRSFVINRPFPASVAAVTGRSDLGAFGALPLFSGGPHASGALSVLHALEGIPGAVRIDEEAQDGCGGSLFLGGDLAAINAALAASPVRAAAAVKPLLGACELALSGDAESGGLELPDEEALWLADGPLSAAIALLGPQFDTVGLFRDGHGLGARDTVHGYNHAKFFAQNAVWTAAVRALADSAAAVGKSDWAAALRAAAELHPAATHAAAAALPLLLRTPSALVGEVHR